MNPNFQPSKPRNKNIHLFEQKLSNLFDNPKQAMREMNLTQNQIDVTDPNKHLDFSSCTVLSVT